MKPKFTLLLCFLLPFGLFAQSNLSYDQKAAEIQKNVWGKSAPVFEIKSAPEKFNNESAVVLARSFSLLRVSKMRFVARTSKNSTFREKVKINDKVALEKFSTLEYTKIVNKTESYGFFFTTNNKKEVFIGIKIIKPNGKEIVVNPSEEVILSNNKNKKGKIAVPGLQVGDIIDYYVCKIEVNEGMDQEEENNKYLFLLADEYPILNYHYTFQFNNKVGVFYTNVNGAPKPLISTNEEKDQILTFEGKDMPKYNDELWSSPLRDLPYFEVSSVYTMLQKDYTLKYRYDNELSRTDNFLKKWQSKFNSQYYAFNVQPQEDAKSYFKSGKALKSLPLDTTMKVLYNQWKFNTFCSYSADDLEMGTDRNTRTANSKNNAIEMCQMLCDMEIPHDVLFVSSRFSNRLADVFDEDDLNAIIRINTSKPMYMGFDKVFTNFNEIPVAYQGEKVIVVTPEKKGTRRYAFTHSESVLPIAPATDNVLKESIQVNFTPENMQLLAIYRNVRETGFMRSGDQTALLLYEDVDKDLKTTVFADDLKKRFNKYNFSKKVIANYDASTQAARAEVKNNFTTEITEQYDQAPKSLLDYKIVNSGLSYEKPYFEHESHFTMETFVKKAGNNYILDIGKLIGTNTKIEADKRKRETDIYMPAQRILNYSININIPAGYRISGANNLNTSKSNAAGSLNITSKLEGHDLNIEIKRMYTALNLKKEQWNDVLTLLDGTSDFSEKKVLLEKIN